MKLEIIEDAKMTIVKEHVDGRSCGTCAMCCKVYDVPEVNKIGRNWCNNFKHGKGCEIYAERPSQCRQFFCNWMIHEGLGPEWKPEHCKFVMTTNPVDMNLYIRVDPGKKTAWRDEPYYSVLKKWANDLMERNNYIFVSSGQTTIILLNDRDVDMGIIQQNETIYFTKTIRNGNIFVNVSKR
jgi:hypothetical protein